MVVALAGLVRQERQQTVVLVVLVVVRKVQPFLQMESVELLTLVRDKLWATQMLVVGVRATALTLATLQAVVVVVLMPLVVLVAQMSVVMVEMELMLIPLG
jgi:hypothetical protein